MIFQTDTQCKFLHIESCYFKLPLDFEGNLGDAIIQLGEYTKLTIEEGRRPAMVEDDSDYDIEELYSEFRNSEWERFKTFYDNGGNDLRCTIRAGITTVDGDTIIN